MRSIQDKLLASASLISLGNSSGSGILYCTEKYLYLVTAKHVLYNQKGELISSEIEIVNQSADIDDDSVHRLSVDLKIVNHSFHKTDDICAVKLGAIVETEGKRTSISHLEGVEKFENGLTPPGIAFEKDTLELEGVLVSNDIYVLGYPTSIGLNHSPQFDYNKPLLRKGIIASTYKQARTIILDCPTYGGNSGGPVIQLSINNGKKDFKLIGIVSQYIPYVQKWYNHRDSLENREYLNSGYSVATSWISVKEVLSILDSDT